MKEGNFKLTQSFYFYYSSCPITTTPWGAIPLGIVVMHPPLFPWKGSGRLVDGAQEPAQPMYLAFY